jgi:hypothetical protein
VPPLDFDFLKTRYEFELQRREQQTASLGLPVGVLGGLGSVMALMARSFSWSDVMLTSAFAPLLVAGVVAFVVCMVYLSRVYHRQTYVYLPKLAALDNTLKEWREFYQDAKVLDPADDDFFEHEFRGRIIDATDRNTDINDERSALLHWARVCLLAVLWLTTLAGIPYVADQVRHVMPRPGATQSTPQPTSTTPQSSNPRPPAFPPNREIREGDIPRRETPPAR